MTTLIDVPFSTRIDPKSIVRFDARIDDVVYVVVRVTIR